MRFGYGRPVDRHGLLALAMTRMMWVHNVCHCEERAERGTWLSIVSREKPMGMRYAY
jgi:hypothetical protein